MTAIFPDVDRKLKLNYPCGVGDIKTNKTHTMPNQKPVYAYEDDDVSIIVKPAHVEGYNYYEEHKWAVKQRHIAKKDDMKESNKKYYAENKEKMIERARKWIAEHPEAYKKSKSKSYKKCREKQKKIKESHKLLSALD